LKRPSKPFKSSSVAPCTALAIARGWMGSRGRRPSNHEEVEGAYVSVPTVAPKSALRELKLRIMFRSSGRLSKEAREGEDHRCSSVYKRLYA